MKGPLYPSPLLRDYTYQALTGRLFHRSVYVAMAAAVLVLLLVSLAVSVARSAPPTPMRWSDTYGPAPVRAVRYVP